VDLGSNYLCPSLFPLNLSLSPLPFSPASHLPFARSSFGAALARSEATPLRAPAGFGCLFVTPRDDGRIPPHSTSICGDISTGRVRTADICAVLQSPHAHTMAAADAWANHHGFLPHLSSSREVGSCCPTMLPCSNDAPSRPSSGRVCPSYDGGQKTLNLGGNVSTTDVSTAEMCIPKYSVGWRHSDIVYIGGGRNTESELLLDPTPPRQYCYSLAPSEWERYSTGKSLPLK